MFIGNTSSESSLKSSEFFIDIEVMDFSNTVNFRIDTGFNVTYISIRDVHAQFKKRIVSTDAIIIGPDPHRLKVDGYINLKLKIGELINETKFYISKDQHTLLLGSKAIFEFGLIKVVRIIESKTEQNRKANRKGSVSSGICGRQILAIYI